MPGLLEESGHNVELCPAGGGGQCRRGAGTPGDCNPGVCWDPLSSVLTSYWSPTFPYTTDPPTLPLQVHHDVVIIMMELDSSIQHSLLISPSVFL